MLVTFPKEILEVFNESQKTKQAHGRLAKKLLKYYLKADKDQFIDQFDTVVRIACREYDRSPAAERLVAFIVKFALEANTAETKTEKDGLGQLLAWLFEYCLRWHVAAGAGVRFRSVQMIFQFLEGMASDAMLSESLFVRIQEALLKRIWDVKPFVRAEAARALARLQDPTDRDCPVVTAFLYLMRHDASPEVRRAAVQSLAITTRTLPEVLTRTRDVSDLVRRTAFDVIVDKVSMRPLSIAKRIKVLKDGMKDRSPAVRAILSRRLLPSWLATCDDSPVRLLKALDVEGSSDVCEKACCLLLDHMAKTEALREFVANFVEEYLDRETRVPDFRHLSSESAFFWRVLVEYLKQHVCGSEGESLLEMCLPLGSALCSFLRTLLERHKQVPISDLEQRLENEFVASHIISLARSVDLSDEFGRNALKEFVRDCLIAPNSLVCYGLVSVLLDLLTKIDPRVVESQLTEEVVEMISELREPMVQEEVPENATTLEATLPVLQQPDDGETKMDRKLEIRMAAIRVAMNEAKEELDNCVARMDFEAAGTHRDRLKSLEEEKARLLAKTGTTDEPKEVKEKENDEDEEDEEEGEEKEKELLCDADTLVKANTMAVELLKRVKKIECLTPSLRTLVTSLILPSIQNPDPAVRNLAVTGLGLIGILDRGLARKYLALLVQISRVDHIAIKVSALRSLFDCFLVYGIDAFTDVNIELSVEEKSQEEHDVTLAQFFREEESTLQTDDDEVKSVAESVRSEMAEEVTTTTGGQQTTMLSFIIELLDNEAAELRTVCVEGLTRLIYLGMVVSSKLLSRLLLLWFNPLTEDDTVLRHCLAVFLPAYCFSKSDYQASMCEAVLPTMRTLFRAPYTSPLAKVDVWNVASLMLHLTDAANLFSHKMNSSAQAMKTQQDQEKETADDDQDKENVLVPGGKIKPNAKAVPKMQQDLTLKLENPCHDELALSLSNVLLDDVDATEIKIYARMLTNLRLSAVNLPLRKELYVMVHNVIQKDILEKQQLRMLQKFQGSLKTVLEAANVDLAALLVREDSSTERTNSESEATADRRMAALLAAEKSRRRQRRSSFTRNLCGSDEEPTLLEATVANVKPETTENRQGNLNATIMERTYLGAKFHQAANRGNVTFGNLTQHEVASNILVNDSEEETNEQEDDGEEKTIDTIKSEEEEECFAARITKRRPEVDGNSDDENTSSTLTPSLSSNVTTTTSTMKEGDASDSEPRPQPSPIRQSRTDNPLDSASRRPKSPMVSEPRRVARAPESQTSGRRTTRRSRQSEEPKLERKRSATVSEDRKEDRRRSARLSEEPKGEQRRSTRQSMESKEDRRQNPRQSMEPKEEQTQSTRQSEGPKEERRRRTRQSMEPKEERRQSTRQSEEPKEERRRSTRQSMEPKEERRQSTRQLEESKEERRQSARLSGSKRQLETAGAGASGGRVKGRSARMRK